MSPFLLPCGIQPKVRSTGCMPSCQPLSLVVFSTIELAVQSRLTWDVVLDYRYMPPYLTLSFFFLSSLAL